jgi:hypothetical protein
MKKLAILSGTFLFVVAVAQGQTQKADKEKIKETKKELKTERVALKKLEGKKVSDLSISAFNADFRGATNVQSKRIDTFDVFTFTTKDGQSKKAYYDIDNKLVGTAQLKTFADLPVKGQQEIKKKYKEYTTGEVFFFDDNEFNDTDMIMYGKQFDDEDLYFVELTKGTEKIILTVNPAGLVSFYETLK